MPSQTRPTAPLSRRRFLRMLGLAGGGLAAARCAPSAALSPAATPLPADSLAAAPSATPTALPSNTRTPFAASIPATHVPPIASPTPAFRSMVGIQKAANYEPAVVRQALQALLDGIGGLGEIVKPGARVAIKVNLTGGAAWAGPHVLPPTEVYLTHPEVVKALCEFLRDAGASKISIVEGVYEPESYPVFGYPEAVKAVGAELVDLNWREPYSSFVEVPVGPDAQVYDSFTFNPVLVEIDTFISIAKLKCHYTAGVTMVMKNLVGISPLGYYRHRSEDNHRSALHGGFQDGIDRRLIRTILDLNRARPIDFSLVDGIWTSEGGEGPWQASMQQVKPGLLIGGKDPVAVDAVSTAVMGFDPAAADRASPFIRSENYLRMASEQGFGTYHLEEIGIFGEQIETVRTNFRPSS